MKNYLLLFILVFANINNLYAKEVGVVLVLGGGGARALAHAGVIEALENNNIAIDLIIGTSGGALIGALYADQPNAQLLKNTVIKMKLSDLVDISYLQKIESYFTLIGPIKGEAYANFLRHHLHNLNFEQLKIPLVAVTTDYKEGKPYPISQGALIPAIIASSSLPPFFSPTKINGHDIYDGGALEPVPVHIAQSYHPKLIIAVNITQAKTLNNIHNMNDLNDDANDQTFYELALMEANLADIVINPEVEQYDTFDDQKNIMIYNAGKKAAEAKIIEIKTKLKLK